jgi:hypothetical protein
MAALKRWRTGAAYRLVSAPDYEEFDATDPWTCPGPAGYPAATNAGTPLSFNSKTQLILTWRAPVPTPANTIFGYKVGQVAQF